MVDWADRPLTTEAPVIGLVFPVHIWGVPKRVLDFLDQLKTQAPEYLFAVANNAGQVANTLVQLQNAMTAKDIELANGWSVVMPTNYLPWGGPGTPAEQNRRFAAAQTKIEVIAQQIKQRQAGKVEKGPLWQRIVFAWLYNLSFPHVPELDRNFWVDERCTKCGICVKLCPSKNIELNNNALSWKNNCEQCLACIQWCPETALQYGKKTTGYPRYHHPEVKVKDLLK